MNESVAHFEEHPELKFDCNNKRAVDSASKNPDSWLKSLCLKGRKQELRDGLNDVAGVIEDVGEVVISMPRIQTQMVERTADVPQILTVQQPVPVPQFTTQTVARPSPAPQLQTMDVPVPQVMIQEIFKQDPVPVIDAHSSGQTAERAAETDRGKCTGSVPSAMMERWAAKRKSRSLTLRSWRRR